MVLRQKLLAEFPDSFVLETNGGWGLLGQSLYSKFSGCVFEKEGAKCEALCVDRPSWAVYEGDSIKLLTQGAASWFPINYIDIDPYGSPWDIVDAFLFSDRRLPDRLAFAVNDGLRNKLKTGSGWKVKQLADVVSAQGAEGLYQNYLGIAESLLGKKLAQRDYRITRWAGYYSGEMTGYAAICERTGSSRA